MSKAKKEEKSKTSSSVIKLEKKIQTAEGWKRARIKERMQEKEK